MLQVIIKFTYLAAQKISNMKTTLTIHNISTKSARYLLSVTTNDFLNPNYKSIQVFISKDEARDLMNNHKKQIRPYYSEQGLCRAFIILTEKK